LTGAEARSAEEDKEERWREGRQRGEQPTWYTAGRVPDDGNGLDDRSWSDLSERDGSRNCAPVIQW